MRLRRARSSRARAKGRRPISRDRASTAPDPLPRRSRASTPAASKMRDSSRLCADSGGVQIHGSLASDRPVALALVHAIVPARRRQHAIQIRRQRARRESARRRADRRRPGCRCRTRHRDHRAFTRSSTQPDMPCRKRRFDLRIRFDQLPQKAAETQEVGIENRADAQAPAHFVPQRAAARYTSFAAASARSACGSSASPSRVSEQAVRGPRKQHDAQRLLQDS